jgi:hypothetical protein
MGTLFGTEGEDGNVTVVTGKGDTKRSGESDSAVSVCGFLLGGKVIAVVTFVTMLVARTGVLEQAMSSVERIQ